LREGAGDAQAAQIPADDCPRVHSRMGPDRRLDNRRTDSPLIRRFAYLTCDDLPSAFTRERQSNPVHTDDTHKA
jgi:hypothetical protein